MFFINLKHLIMKLVRLLSFMIIGMLLLCSEMTIAQTTSQIGAGSSSSSTRGPFQRADTNSTTVFSRWVQIFTAAELATAGVTSGSSISELQWELASSNVIIGSGNATMKVYIKNSSATMAMSDTWVNHIAGSSLVVDESFNTTNNFPGANGWMPFAFTSPFIYTGGALEVAVDWDCSQVSTPAFSGNGAIKWRWHDTAPNDLVVKKTSSSAPSSTISDLKDERANIKIVHSSGSGSSDSVDITFLVNTANITVDPTGLFLGGGVFGGPTEHQLSDANGDGVYEVTVKKLKGFGGNYIFLNGNSGWGAKENIAGLPCSDPNNFDDRILSGVWSDTTLLTCYETCATDTVCPAPPAMVNVTFQVDMSLVDTIEASGVFIAGGFEGWNISIPMSDGDNDGIYDATVSLTENSSYEFKFVNGSTWGREEIFDPMSSDSLCTVTSGGNTNRIVMTGSTDVTTMAYCYNYCFDCGVASDVEDVPFTANFDLMPNPANNQVRLQFSNEYTSTEKAIFVFNSVGQMVFNTTTNHVNNFELNTQSFANGMYFVTVKTNEGTQTKRLVINH